MVYVEDAETGEQIFVDTDDPVFRARLAAAARSARTHLVAAARTVRHRDPPGRDRRRPRPGPGRASPSCAGGGADELRVAVALLLSLLAVPVLVVALPAPAAPPRPSAAHELAAEGLVAAAAARRTGGGTSRRSCCSPRSTLLLASLARPAATVAEPRREGTVILAFDVSTSMAAKDLAPTRLDAAKAAARAFVAKQPSTIRLGVVAFGGLGRHLPAADQRPDAGAGRHRPADARRAAPRSGAASSRPSARSPASRSVSTRRGRTAPPAATTIGYYGSSAVVLLSDGENTTEPDPLVLAELASTAGVRIYPIGLGSPPGHGARGRRLPDRDQARRGHPQADRRHHRRHLLRRQRHRRPAARSTARSTSPGPRAPSAARSPRGSPRLAAALLLLGAGVSVVRSGRVV